MQSKTAVRLPAKANGEEEEHLLETSGDLRRLMKNIALGVMHGSMKVDQAVICVKACEQINVSLYSEIKYTALLIQMGRDAPDLGALPLFNKQTNHR